MKLPFLKTLACSSLSFATLVLFGLLPDLAQAQQQTNAATRQYAAAVRLQNLESYDLAAEAWVNFIKDFQGDPRVGKATHYLGVCYFHDKRLPEALRTFQKVVETYPELEMLDAAYLYLGVTQYSLALKGLPSEGPSDVSPNGRQMYTAAAETFNTLIKKYPNGKFTPDAKFYQGECLYMLGNKQDAIGVYSRLLQDYPKHKFVADALYALGVAQEELKQFQQAGQSYDTFLKRFPENPLATEVQMRRGETLLATGQYSQAVKRFAAAAASPGFQLADYATLRQADALSQMKQSAEAAAVYASVLEKFPKSEHVGRAALAGGKCYYLVGSYAQARALLENLLQSGGDSAPEAAHWVARSLLKESRPAEALAVVERVLPRALGGGQGTLWVAAQLLMDQADAVYEIPQRRPQSIELYAAIAAKYPQEPVAPEALYMAGFAALELGQYETAGKHAAAFLAAYSDHQLVPDVTHVAAESHLLLGKLAEAEKLYEHLLKEYRDHADAELWKVRRGLSLQLQKKYAETIAALEPALATIRSPALVAEARYLIGSSQLELQQYEAAVASLEASLAAQPTWRQADETRLALAHAYRQLGDLQKAKATVKRLIADFAASKALDRAHYRLGEYSYLEGDYDTAASQYRRVIRDWPQSPLVPHALHELGCTELNRKDATAAEKALSTLVENYPDHKLILQARYARAMARHQLQKFAPAVEDLKAMLAAGGAGAEKSDARYLLGLCQMGLEQYDQSAATFRGLLKEDPQYAAAADTQYQLAWSLKLAGDEALAVDAFQKLAAEYADSPRAAEAHYHVAESAYGNKDYGKAASEYYMAMQKAGTSELSEKASHKLGWSYYHQGDFERAQKTFSYQYTTYTDGALAQDAAFMEAECLFKQDKFEQALAAYEKLEGLSSKDFQALALLHAGQAAGQLNNWQKSLQLLTECTGQFADSPYLPEALYEQGRAQQKLGKSDQAVALYQQVIAKTDREVAARAQFMIGEIQFEKKTHKEAVKSFFKVLYGYSYPTWQAEAAYEAARCFEVLAKTTQAVKLYQELIEKFPDSDKVPLAKKRIQQLKAESP